MSKKIFSARCKDALVVRGPNQDHGLQVLLDEDGPYFQIGELFDSSDSSALLSWADTRRLIAALTEALATRRKELTRRDKKEIANALRKGGSVAELANEFERPMEEIEEIGKNASKILGGKKK